MSNTFTVTLPDGEKFSRNSVRNYTHAVAYRPVNVNGPDGDRWVVNGFRSSERLANYQAARLRNAGEPEVVVLPVDSEIPENPYLAFGTPLGDEYRARLAALDLPEGTTQEDILTEDEALQEIDPEDTSEEDEAAAIESALDAAVDAFLGGRQVTGRSWTKIRNSLRPAIIAAAPHLQSPAWTRGYGDCSSDEEISDLIEIGAAQPTTDPYLNGTQR